jgi:hypothetical protein
VYRARCTVDNKLVALKKVQVRALPWSSCLWLVNALTCARYST